MALGFFLKDSLYILHLTGDRDALGADLARFTRGDRVSCGFGRLASGAKDTDLGRESRGLFLAITPPLDEEPSFVEHGGKVFVVRETRRFAGFSWDHWELVLDEYQGKTEIS